MKKIKKYTFLATLLLASLLFAVGFIDTIMAVEPAERFKGYNLERGLWVVGNLGKAYVEGDFVSYELRIDKASKLWGKTEFSISFNFFQPSSGAIYVDGFDTSVATGFQWSTGDFLDDGVDLPPAGWGTHIPTPEAGEAPGSGVQIINYMHAWPPGTLDGSPAGSNPAKERYFTVKNMPWNLATDHIILFYRAHLALDIIWREGLESSLPKELDGDEFESWTTAWHGASFATGSSRHFYLQDPEVGDKTIPIPIALYPSTEINGYKLFCEWRLPIDGEKITLTGTLEGGIPYNPAPVYTGAGSWPTGFYEFTGLIAGHYTVQEELSYPDNIGWEILTSGDATNLVTNVLEGWASFDLAAGGIETVTFHNTDID